MHSQQRLGATARRSRAEAAASFVASGERTLDPAEQLEELREAHGLTWPQVGRALGCSVSTVYAHRGGGGEKEAARSAAFDARLDNLHYLLTELAAAGVTEKSAGRWLTCRSAHLLGHAPADVLAMGHFGLAQGAARAYRLGWSPERFAHEYPEVERLRASAADAA